MFSIQRYSVHTVCSTIELLKSNNDWSRMKKIVILLVLIGLAAFGVKSYLEHKYESEINKALIMAGASRFISYEKVDIGFDSSISIQGVKVTPPDLGDTVGIRVIRFASSDSLFPFKGPKIFAKGTFPKQFSVDIKGVDVGAAVLEQAVDGVDGGQCQSANSMYRYTAVGLDRIKMDTFFEMDFRDPSLSNVRIRFRDPLSSSDISLEVDATKLASVALGGDIPITKIEVTSELNADYANEITAYCAGVFKLTPDVFLQKVVASARFSQKTFGADLGRDMSEAIVKYMQGGQRISVRARPTETLGSIEKIVNLRPNQILNRLNLSASLDGVRVPLMIASQAVEEVSQSAEDEEKGVDDQERKYVGVSLSVASKYLGHRVRVSRVDDKKSIKGYLVSVNEEHIAIKAFRYGGQMTLNVPIEDILKFDVYK